MTLFPYRSSLAVCRSRRSAFTLIEVLVVVAIIALLVGILLPSLASARAQSRFAVCQSTLHQLGLTIVTYDQTQGTIPFGPELGPQEDNPYAELNDGKLATSQLWTGAQPPKHRRMALGLLLSKISDYQKMMYCPADDTKDPVEEAKKLKDALTYPNLGDIVPDPIRDKTAYSSYVYRQLQATSGNGRLDNLGKNDDPVAPRKVVALAMDYNTILSFAPDATRTNHKAQRVNVLYIDASAHTVDNRNGTYTLRDQDFYADMSLVARRAEIFREADKRY